MLLALGALTVLAVLAPLLARLGGGRELGYVFAAGFAGVAILIAFHVPRILDGGTVETSVDWLPSLGVSFALRLNGLSSLFALMVLGVGALIMAYCPRSLSSHDPHGAIYGLLTLFAAAKAAGLGVVSVLLGVLILDPSPASVITLSLAIVLQLLTVPIAGIAIAEAAWLSRAPRTPGTQDELESPP